MDEGVAGGGGDSPFPVGSRNLGLDTEKSFSSQFRGGIWELDPRSGKKESAGFVWRGFGVEGTRVVVMEKLLGPSCC